MATPAENLERIADLASEIRDFTYNTSISVDFVDQNTKDLSQKLDNIANNITGGMSSARIENDISDMKSIAGNQLNMLDLVYEILDRTWKSSNANFAELQRLVEGLAPPTPPGTTPTQKGDKKGPAVSLKNLLDSLRGGILTATIELSNQIVGLTKLFKNLISGNPLEIISGVVGALSSLPSAFTFIVEMASRFVSSLDPGLMAQLSLVVSDLMATIGMGLRPIIQAAIPIIRAFADTLMPVMNQLAPVMQQFGNAMIRLAIPVIATWASAITYLIPIIESIIPFFVDLAEILMILTPAFRMLFDGINRGLNFILGVFHTFMVGIKAMSVALLEAAAWITSWVSESGAEAIKEISASVQGSMDRSMEAQAGAFWKWLGPPPAAPAYTPGASVGAAAKQASYSGIADLGKNMMQAAFGQSQQNAALQTADNTKVMADGFGKLVGWIMGQGKENAAQQGVRN